MSLGLKKTLIYYLLSYLHVCILKQVNAQAGSVSFSVDRVLFSTYFSK